MVYRYIVSGSLDIQTNVGDGQLTLTFNRPSKKNALTPKMMKIIISKLNESAKNDNVKFAVLRGVGNFYSSGNDFSLSEDFDVEEALTTFENLVAALIDYPKLLVAVVNGPAIGMACTTLALFDIVYASDAAYFQTPFSQLGLTAEGCSTYTFPRVFGTAKASKLLYLNESLNAVEAAFYGFVTEVFPHNEIHKQADAQIKELSALPLKSLMLTKQLVRKWDRKFLHSVNQEEVKILKTRIQSEDFIKALTNPKTFEIIKIKSKL